jgi:hypothetical protein
MVARAVQVVVAQVEQTLMLVLTQLQTQAAVVVVQALTILRGSALVAVQVL